MRKAKEKNFTKPLHCMVSEQQFMKLNTLSLKTKCSISEVVRRLIDESFLIEAPPADYPKLITELRHIGTNLNQIARSLNSNNINFNQSYFDEVLNDLYSTEHTVNDVFIPKRRAYGDS